MKRTFLTLLLAILLAHSPRASTSPAFQFPTSNHFLLQPGGADQFYVGTAGKPWPSGMFGCVRTDGTQMHEGLDIRCLQRDKKGEPIDPILATAPGTVAYINPHPGLSNYGRYIVLRHRIEELDICSLYAHLSQISPDLSSGQSVAAGQQIAVMGRTSNTRQRISKERAHLHFELAFALNHNYSGWHKKTFQVKAVDHGNWNGLNLIAIDPARILLAQNQQGSNFRLLNALKHERLLCRVLVLQPNLQWAARYPQLITPNPLAAQQGIAAYELALTFNGLPFELIPRAPSEINSQTDFQLLSVNVSEHERNPCRRLISQQRQSWTLGRRGLQLLQILTY